MKYGWLGVLWIVFCHSLPAAPVILENDLLRLEWESESALAPSRLFVKTTRQEFLSGDPNAILWILELARVGDAVMSEEAEKVGGAMPWLGGVRDLSDRTTRIDNGAMPKTRQLERIEENGVPGVLAIWSGFDVGDEKEVLDVTVKVLLPPGNAAATMTLNADLRARKHTFGRTIFPIFPQIMPKTPESYVLFPFGNWGSLELTGCNDDMFSRYPSGAGALQFLFFAPEAKAPGLYVGLHDASASPKQILVDKNPSLHVYCEGENVGVAGASRIVEFPVVLAPAADAWDASRRYRDWARKQLWSAKGLLAKRDDVPKAFLEVALWLNLFGTPAEIEACYDEVRAMTEGTIAVHWYLWNEPAFDTAYPDLFPAKPDFERVVRKITGNGDLVMPYVNAHLWDTAAPDYPELGTACQMLDAAGKLYVEDYGSPAKLVAVCPYAPVYQEKIWNICRRLVDAGVSGIYLDQIAAIAPVPCYSTQHGHKPGAGGWWTEGYRAMLTPLIEEFGDRIFLTTECTSEPFSDTISGYLIWINVYGNDFPSLNIAYSGYATTFGLPSHSTDDLASFQSVQRRGLLWGTQPGWQSWLHGNRVQPTEERDAKLKYVARGGALRIAAKNFIIYGSLEAPVLFDNPPESVEAHYHQSGDIVSRQKLLEGCWWSSPLESGRVAALSNIGTEARSARVRLEPGRRFTRATAYQPDGTECFLGDIEAGAEFFVVELAPGDLQAVKFTE